jgi:hypothetical protein
MRWDDDIPYGDLHAVAQRLEAFFTAANARAVRLAGLESGQVVDAFADAQARLLRFDDFSRRRYQDALEAARVSSLAGDNVFLACVLSAAVALSQFKQQPRRVGGLLGRQVKLLQERSTGAAALWLFSVASLYAVVGKGAAKHVGALRDRRRRRAMDV